MIKELKIMNSLKIICKNDLFYLWALKMRELILFEFDSNGLNSSFRLIDSD